MQNKTHIHNFDNLGECFNTINELLQNLKSIAMVRCNITYMRVFSMGFKICDNSKITWSWPNWNNYKRDKKAK